MPHWERTVLDGVTLEYEVRGRGEPVVLVHGGGFADLFAPLLPEPALADRYQVLTYHRVGYAGSSRPTGPVSIADQAAHCWALMQHVGIDRAHLVGHSSGGTIAVQVALDRPGAVHTLALLEPVLRQVPGVPPAPPPYVVDALQRYGAGDTAGAIEAFFRGLCGPAYRAAVERALPAGAIAQAVADADTFFGRELPSLAQWSFGPAEAGRIAQPVLAVLGAESGAASPLPGQRHAALLAWLPHVEEFVLPAAMHLLQVQNSGGMAAGLSRFLARHPLAR
jgi:pimeloyl-ACP methyl ester carboxylesterase